MRSPRARTPSLTRSIEWSRMNYNRPWSTGRIFRIWMRRQSRNNCLWLPCVERSRRIASHGRTYRYRWLQNQQAAHSWHAFFLYGINLLTCKYSFSTEFLTRPDTVDIERTGSVVGLQCCTFWIRVGWTVETSDTECWNIDNVSLFCVCVRFVTLCAHRNATWRAAGSASKTNRRVSFWGESFSEVFKTQSNVAPLSDESCLLSLGYIAQNEAHRTQRFDLISKFVRLPGGRLFARMCASVCALDVFCNNVAVQCLGSD